MSLKIKKSNNCEFINTVVSFTLAIQYIINARDVTIYLYQICMYLLNQITRTYVIGRKMASGKQLFNTPGLSLQEAISYSHIHISKST